MSPRPAAIFNGKGLKHMAPPVGSSRQFGGVYIRLVLLVLRLLIIY